MTKFEEIAENAGAFAGACFGMVGYTAGPFVGTALTAGGASTGYLIGKAIGKFIDGGSNHSKNVKKIDKKIDEVIGSADKTVKSFDSIVSGLGGSVSIINGCGVLAVGVALGVGLQLSGAECNPQCVNTLAETLRLSSVALAVSGVGVIGFSGLRNLMKSSLEIILWL